MAIVLIRRIVFGVLGAGAFVMAAEEFRINGHVGPAIGLSLVGIFLFVSALTGKGG